MIDLRRYSIAKIFLVMGLWFGVLVFVLLIFAIRVLNQNQQLILEKLQNQQVSLAAEMLRSPILSNQRFEVRKLFQNIFPEGSVACANVNYIAYKDTQTISSDTPCSNTPQSKIVEIRYGSENDSADGSIAARLVVDFNANLLASAAKDQIFWISIASITVVGIFVIFFFSLTAVLNRKVVRFLSELNDLILSPGKDRKEVIADKKFESKIDSDLGELHRRFLDSQKTLLDQEKDVALSKQARQVAHDIRSPLGALEMALQDAEGLAPERKQLATMAMGRIKKIADDLIQKSKPQIQETTDIKISVEEILQEKRSLVGTQYSLTLDSDIEPMMAKVPKVELQRVLSNLINNSIEAMPGGGDLTISVRQSREMIEVAIRDTGKGIPAEILAKLGQEGVTHGKSNSNSGSGLGIAHAFKVSRGWGGEIKIISEVGKGTVVTLQLPKA